MLETEGIPGIQVTSCQKKRTSITFIHDDTLNFCRDLPGVPERRNAGELAVLPMQVQWEYQVHSPGMV